MGNKKMAQKVEAQGGKGGIQWDDGSEHDAVTKIQVGAGGVGIQYVKFDYVKNGQTEEAPLRGIKGRSIAADPFVISHPEEHLVSVEGWYNPEGLIQGLKFKSNKKSSDLIGYDDGTPFTLQVQDKKITGFHGFAGDYVHSLGAYFAPLASSTQLTPAKKLPALGSDEGTTWDDGAYHGVKKVYVGQGHEGVSAVKFEYANGSQVVVGEERGKPTLLGFEEFEVDADDYITAVQVTYDKIFGHDSDVITSITFFTFKGKTSPPYGLDTEKKFVLKGQNGGELVGFHGRAGDVLYALGAYFVTTTTPLTPAKKLPAVGGDGGTTWDDGAYDGVKKVFVGQAQDGISVVKFVYDKGAEEIIGDAHGNSTLLGFEEFELDYPSEYITAVEGTYDKIFGSDFEVVTMLKFKTNKQTSAPFGIEAGTPFELKEEGYKIVGFHGKIAINHPDEYLVSVEGWYDSSNIILGIQFKTNQKTSDYIGYEFDGTGTKFTLQVQDKKIIGFHGFASDHLNSIGAYFVPLASTTPPSVPPKKLEAKGGETGALWDDSHHDNVKKVYVGQGQDGVAAVKFEYTNGSQVVIGVEHGKSTMLGFEEFELESDEYITSVEGTYDKIFGTDSAVVTMLTFKTNKNKTAGPFGLEGSTPFVFKEEGYKITGFHGRAGEAINAIGVYLAPVGSIPLTPATQGKKLEAAGSDGGALWDDGAFEGVRVVSVGQAQDGIGVVKFVYHKGSQIVVGNEHGKTTMLGFEEIIFLVP
ncbi:unnamed protein product [Thlaspi arvense]|uniref:Jacalin-type lectin domain-containing protein n=1 Tax=Thlaspi arvense TaxID=13288 RepID=A0AAU9S1Q9_THLAR|nr:unnamed protein product [Thlaspi arvense]